MLPGRRRRGLLEPRPHHGRASLSLDHDEARQRTPQPPHRLELLVRLGDSEEAGPPSGRIYQQVRRAPLELLRYLEPDRFFAFESVRLFEGREIEPAQRGRAPRHHLAGGGDRPLDREHARAGDQRLCNRRGGSLLRHDHSRAKACARRVDSRRATGVARRRDHEPCRPEAPRAGNRQAESARLERARGILTLVLRPEPAETEVRSQPRKRKQGCPPLTERYRLLAGKKRQELAKPIHPRRPDTQPILRDVCRHPAKIVADGEHLAALAADRCHAVGIVRLSASRALDMRDEPHPGVSGPAIP